MLNTRAVIKTVLLTKAGIAWKVRDAGPEKYFKINIPAVPSKMVIRNWLILPRMVRVMARSLFGSFTYKILPPNSPILLGVSIVMLQPARTLLYALKNEIFSRGAN